MRAFETEKTDVAEVDRSIYDIKDGENAAFEVNSGLTRDIVENQNANSRAILDFLTNSKMRDLESANQELRLAASQSAQNNYLISQLRPCPSPAYITCNPWAGSGYGGCGSGCGC